MAATHNITTGMEYGVIMDKSFAFSLHQGDLCSSAGRCNGDNFKFCTRVCSMKIDKYKARIQFKHVINTL